MTLRSMRVSVPLIGAGGHALKPTRGPLKETLALAETISMTRTRRTATRRARGPVTLNALMRRPVRVAVAALLLVTAVIVATNLAVLAAFTPQAGRAVAVSTLLDRAEVAMVDQETGMRGFLLTRDREFLTPYEEGVATLRSLDADMVEAARDDPEVASWVEQLLAAERDWTEQWAEPTLRTPPAAIDSSAMIVSLLKGKNLFDRYREVEAGAQRVVDHRREVAVDRMRTVLALGTLVGLLVAVAATLRVRRVDRRTSAQISPPFRAVRAQLSHLAAGDVDARVVPTGPQELRSMAADVNTLGDALRTRGELVASREAELVAARDEAERAGQAKSAFLATMSHEIRTPLNAVLGLTDLLLTTELTELQRGHLETVSRSGDSLLSLINDVLDFSKIESGELDLDDAPFDLEALVYDVAQLFAVQAATKDLDLLVDIRATQGREVVGDALRLRQVLSNLVSNAIKFTSRGHVVVRVTGDVLPEDRLGLRIVVADTGIGIPLEHRDRLFRSFSQVDDSATRAYGGTGLGLAISQRIVSAMGGAITVDSTAGVGSTFTVVLALGLEPQPAEGTRAPSLRGCRVLVVDDNSTNLEILDHQLGRAGASVVLVDSAEQALQRLSAGEVFDLCVTDQHMPVTTGVELAQRARRVPTGEALPFVLLSSVATVPAGLEGLFAARLHKPVHPDRLLSAVRGALAAVPAAGSTSAAGRTCWRGGGTPVPDGGGLRVLIAEDHDVNAQLMELYLDQLGHRSERVVDGRAAVAAVEASTYDVVMMDAQMPVMGGADATARIRALPGHQPVVIAVTASVLASDRAAFAAAGADDFLSKPVRLAVLQAALSAVVAAPPTDVDTGVDLLEEPTAVPTAGGALDPEVVEELRDLGEEGFAQVYTRFADHLDAWVAELLTAADPTAGPASDEAASVAGLAHRLKGSSASLGAAELAALCARVEGLDALSESERSELLTELPQEAARVGVAVRALLEGTPVGA